jgi:hypothetical protein
VGDVFAIAGAEIVDAHHGMALAQQPIGEVRTKKSGSAGYKYAHSYTFALRNERIVARKTTFSKAA